MIFSSKKCYSKILTEILIVLTEVMPLNLKKKNKFSITIINKNRVSYIFAVNLMFLSAICLYVH